MARPLTKIQGVSVLVQEAIASVLHWASVVAHHKVLRRTSDLRMRMNHGGSAHMHAQDTRKLSTQWTMARSGPAQSPEENEHLQMRMSAWELSTHAGSAHVQAQHTMQAQHTTERDKQWTTTKYPVERATCAHGCRHVGSANIGQRRVVAHNKVPQGRGDLHRSIWMHTCDVSTHTISVHKSKHSTHASAAHMRAQHTCELTTQTMSAHMRAQYTMDRATCGEQH